MGVLVELLTYLDNNHFNWAEIAADTDLYHMYLYLVDFLSQLDAETHTRFMHLMPGQMRQHMAMAMQSVPWHFKQMKK
jgi:hypothetical protein